MPSTKAAVVKPNSNAATKNIKNMAIITQVLPVTKQVPVKRYHLYNRGQSMATKPKKWLWYFSFLYFNSIICLKFKYQTWTSQTHQ